MAAIMLNSNVTGLSLCWQRKTLADASDDVRLTLYRAKRRAAARSLVAAGMAG